MYTKFSKSIYQYTRSNTYYDIIEIISEFQIQSSLLEITFLNENNTDFSIMTQVIRPLSLLINLRSPIIYDLFMDNSITNWIINSILCIYLITPLFIFLSFIKTKRNITPNLAYVWVSHFKYLHLYIISYIIHGWLLYQIKKSLSDNIINSVLLGFSLVLIIINIIISIFICKLCISQIYLPGFIGYKFKYNKWMKLFFKLIFPLFQLFDSSMTISIIFLIFSTIWGIIRQFNLIFANPYYNYNTIRIMTCMEGITTGIIISNLITVLIQSKYENDSNICGILSFFICSFSSKCFMILSLKKINDLVYKMKNLSNIDYISQYFILEQLTDNPYQRVLDLKNLQDSELIISNGLLLSHRMNCNECHNEESVQNIRNHLLETRLFEGLDIHNDSFILNCLALDFYLNQKHNIYHPCFLYEKLKRRALSIEDRLILKTYEPKLREALYIASNHNNIHYENFIACENFFEEFLYSIKKGTETYLKFWSEINSSMLNLSNLIKFANQIRKDHHKFKQKLMQYQTKFMDSFAKPLLLAGLYYDILRNNHDESFFMLQKYRQILMHKSHINITDHIEKDIFYSKDNVNIRISGSDTSLGNVINCSGNITQITNLKAENLIGTNIAQIMPDCYGYYHNKFIREYKETGIGNMINKTNHLFCKHEHGHLVPIKTNVSIYPILDHGLVFLGTLQLNKINYEFILINQNGKIEGMTLGIAKDLNFKANNKVHFTSLLYVNSNKEMNVEQNTRVTFNLKSLAESQIEQSISNQFVEKKSLNSTYSKIKPEFTSKISQQPILSFQNFLNDYFGDNHQHGKRLNLKKIISHNDKKLAKGNSMQCEYFEYVTYLEKNYYKLGLQIYKLKLRKCDHNHHKLILKYSNPKSQMKTLNFEPYLTSQETKGDSNGLFTTQPFIKKPQFNRELDNDTNNKELCFIKHKFPDFITTQTGIKTTLSINTIIPKLNNLTELTSNFQGDNMMRNELISFRSSFKEDNIIQIKTLNSYNEFYKDRSIDDDYSIKSQYVGKNKKIKSYLHKTKENVPKQLFRFRSFFLEMNTLLMIILFLLSITSIFVMYNISNTNISDIDRSLMISYHCNQRLANLVEINRRLRNIWLIKANLMSDTRHAWRNISSYTDNCIKKGYEASQYFLGNNSLILNEIQYINNKFQNDFYSPLVKLYSVDKTGKILPNYTETNSFIAGYQIYQVFNTIKKLPLQQITMNNTDILFMLRNNLNDIYIEYDRSCHILVNEISTLRYDIQQTSFFLLLIILTIIIMNIILLIPGLSALFSKKKSLLMQIVNINIEYCQHHIYKIKRFLKGLQENYSDSEFINLYEANKANENIAEFKTNNDEYNKKLNTNTNKMVNTSGIKLDLTKSFLILLAISSIYIIIFYLNEIMIRAHMANINTAMQRILFSSKMLAEQSFAMAIIYEYIGENGTTIVQNKPISLAINQTMPIIGDLQIFLINFRDQNGNLDPNLEFIMIGNACTIVPPDYTKDCISLGSGPGQNGISSINSYVYKALSTALTIFESSNRTMQDANNTLWLWYLRDLEGIFYRISMTTYSYLYDQLLNELHNIIDSYEAFNLVWTLISSFTLLIIQTIIWFPTNRKIINEIISMTRIIQIIPKSIMKRSKFYHNG